jgi:small conductance mechanosensitive channel
VSSHHGFTRLVYDHSDVLIIRPLRILAIILVAMLARWLAHRAIDRLTRPVRTGELPHILRPLKEQVEHARWLDASGILSQRRAQRAATLGSVLKSVVSFAVFLLASLLILGELAINLAPFLAGTSIIGVAIGFGAQNIVKDFLSGMFMILEDQYGVGDIIDFEKASGTVEAVGLRTTRLRDDNGTVWYVRNGEVVRVGNLGQGFAEVVLSVPVPVGASIPDAAAALLDAARELQAEDGWRGLLLGEPELQGIDSMTREESTVRLVVRVRPLEQWRVARELRRRIRERLDELGIGPVAVGP